jgi:hypothetical protein
VKIKLDENLPDRLVAVPTELGHDVDTVHAEQLTRCTDPDVWSAAQAAQRFLITQDLDFSDMRRYLPGTHAGPLLVRLTRPGRLVRAGVKCVPHRERRRLGGMSRGRDRTKSPCETAGATNERLIESGRRIAISSAALDGQCGGYQSPAFRASSTITESRRAPSQVPWPSPQ